MGCPGERVISLTTSAASIRTLVSHGEVGDRRVILALYGLSSFFSAVLLFALQPLFARMALPLLGGSPSVWNTALVFYQAMLLAGYLYADVGVRILGVRRQALLHLALLVTPLAVLPVHISPDWIPPSGQNPVLWLLALFSAAIGAPFFIVATTAPLLQRWFSECRHPNSRDPYFLYAASNAGSFMALLSYPLLIERLLPLTIQTRWWTIGYVLFALLIAACALAVVVIGRQGQDNVVVDRSAAEPGWLTRRARWLLLALIPSSLMLGVTSHVSTDLAAVPLLWIAPLSIYLLSFVLAFARRPPSHRFFVRLLPIAVFAVVFTLAVRAIEPVTFVIPLHLLLLFAVAMVCHGELARDRPRADDLTEFYLWMAGGGVLGGVFNALVAPVLFQSVVEYPLMIVAALLVAPRGERRPVTQHSRLAWWWVTDLALAVAVGLITLLLLIGMETTDFTARTKYLVAFGAPALVAFQFSLRPLRFAMAIAAILLVSSMVGGSRGHIVHSQRTFFGVHRVAVDTTGSYRQLLHGGTIHGIQSLDPARRHEPLGYYSASGPIGQILSSFVSRPARVGVVGLGNGTLAAYALAGEPWTFYEIDGAVERIARDPRWFTYLADSVGTIRIVLGDGRLSLAATDDRYDVLILDAYSSEAIPLHLLSREALTVYLARLTPGGVVVFHISNRHFDLAPVVASLAQDAGVTCLVRRDDITDQAELRRGKTPSTWAVLAQTAAIAEMIATDPRWRRVRPAVGPVWTDDHSSALSALR